MPKGKVRFDRIEISDPLNEDDKLYIEIDEQGFIWLTDSTADDRNLILVRQHMIPSVAKALRMVRGL
jgi:hypothetical protein